MGFRQDFYTLLLDEVKSFSFDLPDHSSLPFLAKELAQNKTFSDNSAVSVLRKLDDEYEEKQIDAKRYFIKLLDTALRKKIRIQEAVFAQIIRCSDLFSYKSRQESDAADEEKTYRRFYEKTKQILQFMQAQTERSSIKNDEPLQKLSEMFMAEALVQEAKAYLYDAGFSLNSKEYKTRKLDRSIQMIDSFFQRKDSAYFLNGYDPDKTSSKELSAEKIDETKKLFSILDGNKDCSSVVIPVIIDPDTGTGLYIYGMESDDDPVYLNNPIIARRAGNGHHCYYTIFEYWGSPRDSDDSYYAPGRLIYRQYIADEGSRYRSTGYIVLEDAIHDYKTVIRERIADMYIDNPSLPEGCPASFRKYFPEEEDYDDLTVPKERMDAYLQAEKAASDKKQSIEHRPLHY